jgi:hypothetical protein
LTDLEAEVGCGSREDNCHHYTHDHTIRGDLGIRVLGFENWLVLFSWLERTRGVLGELDFAHMF